MRNNLADFIKELEKLQTEIQKVLDQSKTKQFLIFHPALSYFAAEFNLTQIPIEKEGKEPGPKELSQIIKQAKQNQIKTILVEPQFSQKQAETIAKEIDGQVVEIDPLSEDYFNNLKAIAEAVS